MHRLSVMLEACLRHDAHGMTGGKARRTNPHTVTPQAAVSATFSRCKDKVDVPRASIGVVQVQLAWMAAVHAEHGCAMTEGGTTLSIT
jgi:hypothetical protein